ncbi:hypothetical protein [Inediibacterium massiliense]|uniref:hypothetical protein n=1 Tax=Inediibacterium massiliense TaxID=1658111 RepID=UPI0006B6013E|nr:hypothetical protein [Inediibacterium massiliense]
MSNSFVKVPHQWYEMDKSGDSFISKLGAKRFTLWFAINKVSVEMNMSKVVQLQIKQLIDELNFLKGFSRPMQVKKMLLELKKAKLIECNTLTNKTKPTDLLNVKIKPITEEDYPKGWAMISTDLYADKINRLECIGFMIFCFLFKYHRQENGNQDSTNGLGYAEVNRDHIGRILGLSSVKTISKYTDKIKKARNLIKILPQEEYFETNEFGEEVKKWRPNRYVVYPKVDVTNKYYIKQ